MISDHNEVVKILIEAKCDLNVETEYRDTALRYAAKNSHNEVVKTLIQAICEVIAKDQDRDTALNYLALNHIDLVISLMKSGAELDMGFERIIPKWLVQNNKVAGALMKKYREGKFNSKLHYNMSVSVAISQGHHELVMNFLIGAKFREERY